MADLDTSIPHKFATSSVVIKDGTTPTPNSITMTLKQGTISWTETGREYAEAMEAGRHVSGAPVLQETNDTNVTLNLTGLITSFKGNSNTHPYEAFTFSGNAASWVSTATGSKKSLLIEATFDSTEDGSTGGSQTVSFAYAVPTSVECDMAAANGLGQLSVTLTDHENAPTSA